MGLGRCYGRGPKCLGPVLLHEPRPAPYSLPALITFKTTVAKAKSTVSNRHRSVNV